MFDPPEEDFSEVSQGDGLMRSKYGRSRESSPRGEITVAVVSNGSREMVSKEAFDRIARQRDDDVNQLQGVLETERNTLRQVMSTAREAVSSLEDDKAVLEEQLFVLQAEIERLRAQRGGDAGQCQKKCADLEILLTRKEEEIASLAVQVRLNNERDDTPMRYPWEKITATELLELFRQEPSNEPLSPREFSTMMSKLGFSDKDSAELFRAMDQDGSGYLDVRECFVGLSCLIKTMYEERIELAFDIVDTNSTGLVSSLELESFLQVIAPSTMSSFDVRMLAARVFREADTNRSGRISYSEFLKWPGNTELMGWIDDYHTRQSASYDSQETVVLKPSSSSPSKGDSLAAHRVALRLLNAMLRRSVEQRKMKGFHFWVSSFLAKRAAENAKYAKVNRMMGVQVDEQKAELQSTIAMLKAEAANAQSMFQVRLDEELAAQRHTMERESVKIGSLATARVRADAEREMASLQDERLAFCAEKESLMAERDSLSSALAAAMQERVVEPWIVIEEGAKLEEIDTNVTTSWKDNFGVLQAKSAEESLVVQVERRSPHNVYHVQMHSVPVPHNATEISVMLEIAELKKFMIQKVSTMRNASPPRSRSPGRSGGRAAPKSPRGKASPRSRGEIDWDAIGIRTVVEPVPPPPPPGFLERAKREVEAETGAVENVVEEVFGEEDSAAPIPKIKVSSFAGAHNTPPRSRRKERTPREHQPAVLKEETPEEKEANAVREFQEKVAQIDQQGDKPDRKMGWLWKKGGGHDSPKSTTRRSWYRRWFKLEGPLLHYYEQASPSGDGFDDPYAPGHGLRWTGDLRKAHKDGGKLKVALRDPTKNGRFTLEIVFEDRTLILGAAEDTPVDDAKNILGMWEESLREHADYFSKPEFALFETF